MPYKSSKVKLMLKELDKIIEVARSWEERYSAVIEEVHPKYRNGARNLIHYRAFRSKGNKRLQNQLRNIGLSRLGKAESHIMPSLLTTRQILRWLSGKTNGKFVTPELSIRESRKQQKESVKALLGEKPRGRRSRIMVTMPDEASYRPELVKDMVRAGMNVARINCAHGSEELWRRMIENIHNASKELGVPCAISMDLAGPKIRTGSIEPGPEVIKVKPLKSVRGRVVQPARVWIGPINNTDSRHFLPVEDISKLEKVKMLYFRDTRNKKRKLRIVTKRKTGYWATVDRTTYFETGMLLYFEKELIHPVCKIGRLPAVEGSIYLRPGNTLRITSKDVVARHRSFLEKEDESGIPVIKCTNPQVLKNIKVGERVLLDDGKFTGELTRVEGDNADIRIDKVRNNGAKLHADKGINFPKSRLKVRGLTPKDKEDLKFVIKHADIISMSFVNTSRDVKDLLKAVERLKEKDQKQPGIVLKIETMQAYKNMTSILLAGMHTYPVGIMIARGDLALEVGWKNIANIQPEILKLCHAAHVPDIWATQVFETLAKTGVPSRAEITDVWVAQRSECVMLNKGPYIVDAIELLDTILSKLNKNQNRDVGTLPMLEISTRV